MTWTVQLAQRMCNYLSLQLQRSARMKFDFKLKENVKQYVSYDTLFGWKKDLVSICKYKVSFATTNKDAIT
jgi:hypothetical protein